MASSSLLSDLEDLSDDLADLEETLSPLLDASLSQTTKKLPLLDRAKLHVTVVYAIESLLFSYLKLNGISTQDHPLTTEIHRIKSYFAKIRSAETPNNSADSPSVVLNKAAASRVVTHALAGQLDNKKVDLEAKEREERERALKERLLAKRKAEADKGVERPGSKNNVSVPDDLEEGEAQELSEEGEVESDGQHVGSQHQSRGEAMTMDEKQYLAAKQMHKNRKRKSNATDGPEAASASKKNKKDRKADKRRKKES